MMQDEEQKVRYSRDIDALCQALEQEGCPVCQVTLESMERVMDSWQYEGFSDLEHRHALIRSRGFCPRHTWQLSDLPTAFQLSLVYSNILPDILADMQRSLAKVQARAQSERGPFWRRFWWGWRGRRARLDSEPRFQDCPFCVSQAEIEGHLITSLLSMFSSAELSSRLRQATGLCLPHLAQAYREAESDTQVAALLACQYTCLQRNLGEIEELVRKHDYRFLHDPQGNEMTAWRRSVGLFVGKRSVW